MLMVDFAESQSPKSFQNYLQSENKSSKVSALFKPNTHFLPSTNSKPLSWILFGTIDRVYSLIQPAQLAAVQGP